MSARLLVLRELGRALRDQRVALAHEGAVLEPARDDHLASVAEGVGHDARVRHRDRLRAVAVTHAEPERVANVPDRAVHDLAREVVRAARLDLARLAGL